MPTLSIVHIGEQWPHYIGDCIKQARLVNPVETTEILLLVNKRQATKVAELETLYTVKTVFLEDLQQSEKHREFLGKIVNMVDLQFRKQYWQYVFERFFVLEDYCKEHHSGSIYMMETDNMLYVPLQLLQQSESLFTQDMAAPFDKLEEGYPSIVFFRNLQAISKFTEYMMSILRTRYLSDMIILGKYRLEHPEEVFPYPVLPHSCNTPLRKRTSLFPRYSAEAEQTQFLSDPRFLFVFDAIAYGQALGGIDPRNVDGVKSVGFQNESALYSITETQFGWCKLKNLWFPLVNHKPLVNLHIHSKALSLFLSDSENMPSGNYDAKELQKNLENDLKDF
jgi:hypothetical protein